MSGGNASAGTDTRTTVVYTLYLQRHLTDTLVEDSFDGTWDVYLAADTTVTVTQPAESKPVCEQNPDAVWIGWTGMSEIIEISDIHKAFTIESKVYDMTAQLRYTKDAADGSFILVLPDITVVGETPYETGEYFTTQVEVKQYLKPGRAYTAGQPALFKRKESETE